MNPLYGKLLPLMLVLSFAWTISAGQNIQSINGIKPYFFDLPLDSGKNVIIEAAKKKFKNNLVEDFVVEANIKTYFVATTIAYDYFTQKPLITRLKIYEEWSFDDPSMSDSELHIVIDAYYGSEGKGERNMMSQYSSLQNSFKDRFAKQKSYSYYAGSKIAGGHNYFISSMDKNPIVNLGWSNGGNSDYSVIISFIKKINCHEVTLAQSETDKQPEVQNYLKRLIFRTLR
ncbi:hypothetical protein [Solitalea koreensis]|nr:hypothetical protein [Solitalea koreensis]